MKILTLVGTRPELIRLSLIISKLDALVDHVFVYTNQNFDYNLSGLFFDELKIRKPNYYFDNVANTFAGFLSYSLLEFEKILVSERPDKILVLGDTNTGLLTLVARRMGIPIYHMEAGNRCLDDRVPEELNRRLIDHISTINLPYTENSKQNLLSEGFDKNKVFKTGNPIYEVLSFFGQQIKNSLILNTLDLKYREYVLVTAHRAENVDDVATRNEIVHALNYISERMRVVFPIHPRTKGKMVSARLELSPNILVIDPVGLFDFVKLERNARLVVSDSGTVQEEACIYGVPSLTIRRTTERQETVECGSNILTGVKFRDITTAFDASISRSNCWSVPEDYLVNNVSDIVINILLGGKG